MSICIHFVRHGEVHNPDKVFYGRMPGFHLSPTGFREARGAGTAVAWACKDVAERYGLPRTSALVHSPLLRARETAEVLAAAHPDHRELAQNLEMDKDVIEVGVPSEGRPLAELEAMSWEVYNHGREAEGFETFPDVLRRLRAFVGRLLRSPRHTGTQVIVVSHGDVCLAARMWALTGMTPLLNRGPLKNQPREVPFPGHCSLTTLIVRSDITKGSGSMEQPEWVDRPAPSPSEQGGQLEGAQARDGERGPPEKRQRVGVDTPGGVM